MQRPWRVAAYWRAMCGLLTLLPYAVKDHLLRSGTTQGRPTSVAITSVISEKMPYSCLCLLPNDLSLCQVDKNKTKQTNKKLHPKPQPGQLQPQPQARFQTWGLMRHATTILDWKEGVLSYGQAQRAGEQLWGLLRANSFAYIYAF